MITIERNPRCCPLNSFTNCVMDKCCLWITDDAVGFCTFESFGLNHLIAREQIKRDVRFAEMLIGKGGSDLDAAVKALGRAFNQELDKTKKTDESGNRDKTQH